MATVNSVIKNIKNRSANISSQCICAWLSKLDEKISHELMRNNDFVPYQFPEDAEKELIVKSPHDNIYNLYVYAMIDFFSGELAKYSSSAVLFEQAYVEFSKEVQTRGNQTRLHKELIAENSYSASCETEIRNIQNKKHIRLVQKQTEETKKIYPEFDFEAESKNPDFCRLVKIGVPVKNAYEVTHVDEIIKRS